MVGRKSRRRVFGNELAGIPSQGWIRPSVAPKSFHAYVWSGCWMSSVHVTQSRITPKKQLTRVTHPEGIHILYKLIAVSAPRPHLWEVLESLSCLSPVRSRASFQNFASPELRFASTETSHPSLFRVRKRLQILLPLAYFRV